MVKINLKEGTDLEFDMLIEGNINKLESLGLCIQEDKFELKLPCVFANSKVSCSIPILEGIVLPGEKTISLEVVIDGKVYRPFEQTVEFEKPVSIQTHLATIEESTKTPVVAMRAMSVVKKQPVVETQEIAEPIKETPVVEQKVNKSPSHILTLLKNRTSDLLVKVEESKIPAKVALRDITIKLNQVPIQNANLLKFWEKMNSASNIVTENINTDQEAVTSLKNLNIILTKLLEK